MSISFFIPGYIDIVQKTGDRWIRLGTSSIYNLSGKPYVPKERYSKFGLTAMGILIELYQRYQGLDGWYLVHMAEKEYYYCGANSEDVQSKLSEMGINHHG
jgi:hypothetical protein